MSEQDKMELKQSNEILDLFGKLQISNDNMIVDSVKELSFPRNGELRNNEICFYKIKQLSFDEEYPRREAFENVLLSINNQAFNFVYVLTGTEEGIELDIGVVQNENENTPVLGKKLSAVNYGEIVANVFEGNFSGSILEKLNNSELDKLIGSGLSNYKNAGAIVGIPSMNENDNNNKEYDFQGIDRLVNSMLGLEWRLVIVCEPVPKKEILEIREDIYELYNRLSVYSKKTVQHSDSDAQTISFGKNKSDSSDKNWGYSKTKGRSFGTQSDSRNKGHHTDESNSEGSSKGHSEGENQSYSLNKGSSNSVTVEMANKHAEELMKYINEDLLERLKTGYSKGLFKSSIYYMAKEPTHANRLKVGIISLFQGDKSSFSPLSARTIDLSSPQNRNILKTFQNQYIDREAASKDALLLKAIPFGGDYVGLNSYLTTNEISLIAGLPQKEVPGVTLKEGVGFGLNEKKVDKESSINLGVMVQKGRDLKKLPFYLAKENMAKHTFIAGVTGSGKTTTCHRLLSESEMPFLVIEPAKTEYRTLINKDKDLIVLTLGNETIAPFRINPFELIQGEVISAHVDMIKATFTSAFPMEASMPQILEESIYNIYQKKGWNIDINENEIFGERAFDLDVDSFPILSDLLEEMKYVVESKNFSGQMQSDYIGSLVSRLSNLTVGSKGSMLNCEHSIDFRYIAHHNVILEMEELKSPEDKALFMGFILSRLSAVIKEEHKKNKEYKHLTLVEEAHRLLSKVEYGDSGSKKSAVETFTDLLAEVRKYGEGLIIVDQIPNKLAPEVLKNTNTKIIHKILAKDDKEAVGDTMLMDDKQKEYLSALDVGNAIVFSEQTEKPIHVHITAVSDTNEEEIDNSLVKERFLNKKDEIGGCYKYLEITAIMPLFKEVARDISKLEIDENKNVKLNNYIKSISKNYKISEQEVWRKIITRFNHLKGKGDMSIEEQEKSVTALVEFFTERFNKEDFSIEDICQRKAHIKLM